MKFNNNGHFKVSPQYSLSKFLQKYAQGVKTIYDHGCGYGGWTDYISQISNAKTSLFDPDRNAIAYTKKLLGDRYWEESGKGPFDMIICFAVLELLNYEEQFKLLMEFSQKLNGVLLVQYNVYNPFSIRWIAIWLFKKGNPTQWHEQYRFNRSYLSHTVVEKMFRESGYTICERCAPVIESHLPRFINTALARVFPMAMHSTIFYALRRN